MSCPERTQLGEGERKKEKGTATALLVQVELTEPLRLGPPAAPADPPAQHLLTSRVQAVRPTEPLWGESLADRQERRQAWEGTLRRLNLQSCVCPSREPLRR